MLWWFGSERIRISKNSGWRRNVRFINSTPNDLPAMTKPEEHEYFAKQFYKTCDIRYLKLVPLPVSNEPKSTVVSKTTDKKRKIFGQRERRKRANKRIKEKVKRFEARQ